MTDLYIKHLTFVATLLSLLVSRLAHAQLVQCLEAPSIGTFSSASLDTWGQGEIRMNGVSRSGPDTTYSQCYRATLTISGDFKAKAFTLTGNFGGILEIGQECKGETIAQMIMEKQMTNLEALFNSASVTNIRINSITCCNTEPTGSPAVYCNDAPETMKLQVSTSSNGMLAGSISSPGTLLAVTLAGLSTLAMAVLM